MARNDTEAKREESASNRWKSGKIAPASTLPVILIRQRHRRWYCFSTTTRPLVLVCTCTFALSPHAGRTAEPEVAGKECTVGGNPTVFLRGFPAGCRRHTGLPVCHGTKGRGSLIPQQPYVVGRVAMQSASRDDEIVRCRADYKVANGKAAIFAYQNLVYANTEWTGYR